jgi:quinol monooxygenase YgiN
MTFTVDPAKAEALLSALSHATEHGMRQRPGFVSASLHISRDKRHVTNYAQWRSQADLAAMMRDPTAQSHMREAAGIADSFEPIYYDLRETHIAEGAE